MHNYSITSGEIVAQLQHDERATWVQGYEERYAVTDHGRVWSCFSARFLRPVYGQGAFGAKYLGVQLSLFGKRSSFSLHRLVAKHFVAGEAVDLEVCHNDGDSSNNYFGNLRWDTHANNMAERKTGWTRPKNTTDEEAASIVHRWHRPSGKRPTLRELAVEHSVTVQCISAIVNGRSKAHVCPDITRTKSRSGMTIH